MKYYLKRITIPSEPPPPDSNEYKEGDYRYTREIIDVNRWVFFNSVKLMNEHYSKKNGNVRCFWSLNIKSNNRLRGIKL